MRPRESSRSARLFVPLVLLIACGGERPGLAAGAARASVAASAAARPDSVAIARPDSVALVGALALPDSVAERRVGRGDARLVGDGTAGPYPLGSPFVLAGSESVAVGGAPLPLGSGYTLDTNRGSILFSREIPAGDSIVVSYRRLPFVIEPSYARWLARPLGTPAESVAAAPGVDYGKSLLGTGGLRVGGTKSLALVVGSDKDLTLEQALRVSIEGALTRDVSVVARLSDENLPFTPEGSSARLDELDKVFVEVRGPHLGATLGDYEVNFASGEFSQYRRVLKGALGRADYAHGSGSASAGVSRGRFLSVEVRGEEGRQGPYRIVDGEFETVVAGSEEVYQDGERLSRGEDNDYVIDYSRGEIRFTSKRPVRAGSRIAVDFQVTGEDYKRSFATASARGRLGSDGAGGAVGASGASGASGSVGAIGRAPANDASAGASVGITLLSESDDADNPTAILLSDADRESLALAGDSDPLVSGAAYTGTGGDYDTTDGRFVFAGKGRGAFTVAFSAVGRGGGHYDADLDPESGDRIFVFDTIDSVGDFDPVRRLARPNAHRVLSLDARGSPAPGLSLAAEGAVSTLDANTLSDRDDGDNGGGAWRLSGEWTGDSLAVGGARLGSLAVTGRARRLGKSFAPFSRVEEIHLDERWNTTGFERPFSTDVTGSGAATSADESALPFREDLVEGEATYRPRPGLLAGIEAGSFTRDGSLDARREAARFEARSARAGHVGGRAERIRSDGDDGPGRTERLSADLGTRVGALAPSLHLSRDTRRLGRASSFSGSRRDRGALAAALTPLPSLRIGTEFALEAADTVDRAAGALGDLFRADEEEVSASLADASVSLSSRYRRRHVNFAALLAPDATTHLGRVELSHRSWDGALTGEWNYDASTFRAARRQRVLLEVPVGEVGDFDSLGNFFPGQGRFRARDIELPSVPTTDLTANARIVVAPDAAARAGSRRSADGGAGAAPRGWARLFRGLEFETLARVSERSTTARKGRLLLFNPAEFQRDDTTVRGETLVREEATWSAPGGRTAVRARYGRTDVEDNSVEGARREELRHEVLLRCRGSVSARVIAEAQWEPRRSRQRVNGAESSRLLSDFLQAEGTFLPGPLVSVSLSGRVGLEHETRLDERLDSIEGATTVSATFLRRGRLSSRLASLRFVRDERSRSGASPLTTRFEGEEWRLTADYDLSRYLGASLSYSGDNRRIGGATHLLRMEARALF